MIKRFFTTLLLSHICKILENVIWSDEKYVNGHLVLKVKMLRAGVENVIWFWSSQKRFCVYV